MGVLSVMAMLRHSSLPLRRAPVIAKGASGSWRFAVCHNFGVDISLPTVIIVVASAIGISIALWVVSIYRQRRVVKEAREWLAVEGTIESGTVEAPEETNKVLLPTFAFSYQVGGDYYAGRFVLMPGKLFPSKELVQSIIDRMIGRKLLLRYDPHHPEVCFIPDEFIDGLEVEQKIGSHAIHRYYPRG